MSYFDYVIVGAGFAGAATAYHLARAGVSRILLLEQESIPGFHSSGRNAAMLRQCVSEPDLTELARAGAAFIHQQPADWPEPVPFKQNGSLLLASGAGWFVGLPIAGYVLLLLSGIGFLLGVALAIHGVPWL